MIRRTVVRERAARGGVLALAALLAACPMPQPQPSPQPQPRPVAAPDPRHTTREYAIMAYAGGRLRVVLDRSGDNVVESVANEYGVAVTIDAVRTTTNLREAGPIAPTVTIPARSTVAIATWTLIDPRGAWSERSEFRHQFGDPAATADAYVYALPFPVGDRYAVGQGFGGAFSHTGDSEYAVDFNMPEGTTVRAARDGVVVATHAAATGAGLTDEFRDRSRANWIYVLHGDGTLGMYWHLARGGVGVEPGQRVTRGDPIGTSGFTGYAQVPHLHFAVVSALTGARARTFPFVIKTSARDRRGEAPVDQKHYTAFE